MGDFPLPRLSPGRIRTLISQADIQLGALNVEKNLGFDQFKHYHHESFTIWLFNIAIENHHV